MRKKIFYTLTLLLAVTASLFFLNTKKASADVSSNSQQAIAAQIIAREKAGFEAWQRKDKAFFNDLFTDDSSYFGFMSPYLQIDPKQNFLPKMDKYFEMFKMDDFEMLNPRVQVYGDVAILTYNHSVAGNFAGQQMNYTGKMTVVYVKQGNTWRVAHGHESINPANR
jgi:uncharacterized protein (TIGR02246 family)